MTRLAIITGASKGIGKEAAHYFAYKGYNLALIARDEARLKQISDTLSEKFSVDVQYYSQDVVDYEGVKQCINAIAANAQSIDILFNGAGLLLRGTSDIDLKDFNQMIDVNLRGIYNLVHAVVPYMKAQQSGYIFNLASYAGKRPLARSGAYCMTKHGVLGYSQSLSLELANLGIKVTAICPSVVDTDMTKDILNFPDEEKIFRKDILRSLNYLLELSPNAYVDEITIKATFLMKKMAAY